MNIPLRQLLSCCCNYARTKAKTVRSLLSALLKVRELIFPITSSYLKLFLHQCLLSHFIFYIQIDTKSYRSFSPNHLSFFLFFYLFYQNPHLKLLSSLARTFFIASKKWFFITKKIWFLASISSFNLIPTVQPSYL